MQPDQFPDGERAEEKNNGTRRHLGPELPIFDQEELDDYDGDDEENEDGEEYLEQEDAFSAEIEGEPRTILITGACGNIGKKLRAAWAEVYDMVLIDKSPGDDDEVNEADLAALDDDWITHFHGVDTVVHLAGNGDEFAPWNELIEPNLDALANVFHAAALAGVERIIFASSNHVMGGYQGSGDEQITVELDPKPDGPYGVTKLVGERLGLSLARAFDLTFIALRLGWVQEGSNRASTLPDDWSRKMWLSNGDMVRLFDCAVEAEIEDRSFVLANGMSRNHGMRWDLSDAAELLGYLPVDDAFAEEPHVARDSSG